MRDLAERESHVLSLAASFAWRAGPGTSEMVVPAWPRDGVRLGAAFWQVRALLLASRSYFTHALFVARGPRHDPMIVSCRPPLPCKQR